MTQPTSWTEPLPRERPPVGHIVLTVVGALLILISLALGVVGGILTWAYATQRDSDGFFHTSTKRFETISYAITSEEIDLGTRPGRGEREFDFGDIATVRLTAEGEGETPIFVGIGRERDVDRYLSGVAHAEIDDIDFDPFRVTYRYRSGGAPDSPPDGQDIWVASATGTGVQRLVWEPEGRAVGRRRHERRRLTRRRRRHLGRCEVGMGASAGNRVALRFRLPGHPRHCAARGRRGRTRSTGPGARRRRCAAGAPCRPFRSASQSMAVAREMDPARFRTSSCSRCCGSRSGSSP